MTLKKKLYVFYHEPGPTGPLCVRFTGLPKNKFERGEKVIVTVQKIPKKVLR